MDEKMKNNISMVKDPGEDEKDAKDSGCVQHFYTENGSLIICGYNLSILKTIITSIFCVLTAGLLLLVFHWKPEWRLLATHKKSSLKYAKKVLIKDIYKNKWTTYHIKTINNVTIGNLSDNIIGDEAQNNVGINTSRSKLQTTVRIYLEDGTTKDVSKYRTFKNKKVDYVWDDERNKFFMVVGLEKATQCIDFHSVLGHTKEHAENVRCVYGYNLIDVPVQGILKLIVLEFFNPFYMFQVFSVLVWIFEDYYYYCIAIVIMSVFGITTSVIQTRRNQKNLQSTVQSSGTVQVCRNTGSGIIEEIPSDALVPGDVILIPSNGCTMHVDAVLLNGSCIVNESMLTGESVPVTKTAISQHAKPYDMKTDSNHTLFCGTKVIQTRYYKNEPIKAVVLRTGFSTTKGQLVRSIMYPLPADFKFDRDSYKFIIILTVVAAIGLTYTVTLKAGRSILIGDIILKSLDILTIVIPPALPAAMTLGRLYAIARLRRMEIFCINPRVINVCGSINCVCFDKTGTLTEDGLDMWGIVPARTRDHTENGVTLRTDRTQGNNEDEIFLLDPVKEAKDLENEDMLKVSMSVCHSLTYIDEVLTGDPLEVKMFESTGWVLEESVTAFQNLECTIVKPKANETNELWNWGIIHQYQFSSSLQRSSVICKNFGRSNYFIMSKGSPEMIASLSEPETVPTNLKAALHMYTRQGYRVLAFAYKELSEVGFLGVHKLHRDDAEKDLKFLGLMVMENRLKKETKPVIDELTEAAIKVVMVTGDNIDTAVSVATECGILHFGDCVIRCSAVMPVDKNMGTPPSLSYTQITLENSDMQHSPLNDEPNKPHHSHSSIPSVDPQSVLSSSINLVHHVRNGSEDSDIEFNNRAIGDIRLVMDGTTWEVMKQYYPEQLQRIITKGAVFARMSSDQKQALIQDLQSIGYYVAMCGDGANDCGALKAAHAGISVSGEESSVASPFTSQEGHVGCVPSVIREGRAALTTSFGLFKFMIAYSMTEFFSVAFLYYFDSNLTDFQFLYIDIVLSMNFAFFFGRTRAFPGKICKTPPGMSLLGFVPLFSLILQLLIIIAFQLGIYFLLLTYPWYSVSNFQSDIEYLSYENFSIFALSMFQYITLAIAFSRGSPYRQSIFTNYIYLTSLFITVVLGVYITVYPADWLIELLELKVPPEYGFRIVIVGMAFVNFVICLIAEKFLVEYLMQSKKFIPKCLREDNTTTKNSYKTIERELENDPNWPPPTQNVQYGAVNGQ